MEVNISIEVQKILYYAMQKQLIKSEDIIYTKNRLLEVLSIDEISSDSTLKIKNMDCNKL